MSYGISFKISLGLGLALLLLLATQLLSFGSFNRFSQHFHELSHSQLPDLLLVNELGKRSVTPVLISRPYTKLAGSRLYGNSASNASTEVAAGSSVKIWRR